MNNLRLCMGCTSYSHTAELVHGKNRPHDDAHDLEVNTRGIYKYILPAHSSVLEKFN